MLTGIIIVIAILLVGCILFFIIRECEKIDWEEEEKKILVEERKKSIKRIIAIDVDTKFDNEREEKRGPLIGKKVWYQSQRSGKIFTAKVKGFKWGGFFLKLKRPRYEGYFWRKATEVTFLQ